MILLNHFLWQGITEESISSSLFNFLVPFVACGVNLFFLISGWFQVKCNFKSIFKLLITIFLFICVNHIISIPFVEDDVFHKFYQHVLFPISMSPYWFIKVYLALIITSPILNYGLNNMNIVTLRRFVVLFIFFTTYSCAIGGNLSNQRGFSYLQGCMMYCLGYYLKRDCNLFVQIKKRWIFLVFLSLQLISALGLSMFRYFGIFATYNSIFIILASVALFLFFTKLNTQSNVINTIAAASLGCYLLQDGYFGWQFLYKWLHNVFLSANVWYIKVSIYVGVFIGIWIVSLILSPLVKLIANSLTKFMQKIVPNRWIELFNVS